MVKAKRRTLVGQRGDGGVVQACGKHMMRRGFGGETAGGSQCSWLWGIKGSWFLVV